MNQILLFCVLFGGFLAWGIWEYFHPVYRISGILDQEELEKMRRSIRTRLNIYKGEYVFPHHTGIDWAEWSRMRTKENMVRWNKDFIDAVNFSITNSAIDRMVQSIGLDLPQSVIDAKLEEVKNLSSLETE